MLSSDLNKAQTHIPKHPKPPNPTGSTHHTMPSAPMPQHEHPRLVITIATQIPVAAHVELCRAMPRRAGPGRAAAAAPPPPQGLAAIFLL